jgi:hypothetical protein
VYVCMYVLCTVTVCDKYR